MNPAKKDWPGEIITHGSKFETTRKFVPFTGHDDGYHVPYCIYEILKNRKFAKARTIKRPNGMESTVWSQTNEFNIELLPQLTADDMIALDRKEGLGAGYSRRYLKDLDMWYYYVVKNDDILIQPTNEYLNLIITGLEENFCPDTTYISKIKQLLC
jgi:hypothetical protein